MVHVTQPEAILVDLFLIQTTLQSECSGIHGGS